MRSREALSEGSQSEGPGGFPLSPGPGSRRTVRGAGGFQRSRVEHL
jgi:hypothetical protein